MNSGVFIVLAACVVLGNSGSKSMALQKNRTLLSGLESSNWRISVQARVKLKAGGNESIPVWQEALQSEDWQVRYWAVEALGYILDITRVDIIIPLLDDENNYVRRNAVKAVIQAGGKLFFVKIRPLAKDDDFYVRRTVMHILCEFEDKDSLTLFIEGLKDTDPVVRYESAVALGRLGDPSSWEALNQVKTDEHDWVRCAVEDALKKLNSP
jgi:HEAT repeat protein